MYYIHIHVVELYQLWHSVDNSSHIHNHGHLIYSVGNYTCIYIYYLLYDYIHIISYYIDMFTYYIDITIFCTHITTYYMITYVFYIVHIKYITHTHTRIHI